MILNIEERKNKLIEKSGAHRAYEIIKIYSLKNNFLNFNKQLKIKNMRYQKSISLIKFVFLVFISVAIIATLPSCARKITFLPSSEAPGASGKVKIKKDKNDNYNIDVNIERLVPANKLDPPAKTYVVWIETEQNETKNMGQITSSSSLLSSKLKASFTAVSPSKPTRLFITAEENGTAFYPGSRQILTTKTF
jgi:hypothetical protein